MIGTEQERGRKELVDGLSRRFIELRRKAGTTQQGLADAMGKSRAGERLVRRLERGGIRSASLVTVAEYLRAVRAGFGDMKDIIDRYTSLPIPEPQRKRAEAAPLPRVQTSAWACENGDSPPERSDARYSPRFPAAVQEKREPCSRTPNKEEELRVLRIRRRAGYWELRRVFEHFLHSELSALGISPASWFRRATAQYARRVFNALFRTRGKKEPKRQERLAQLRERAEKKGLVAAVTEYMEAAVKLVFDDMAEHDELDWLPPAERAQAIMSVKPKHRVGTDSQMCLAEWSDAYARYARAYQETYARAHEAALRSVATIQCDGRTAAQYKVAAMYAANIGANTLPGTKRRSQSMTDFSARQWPQGVDRRLVAQMLAVALEVWDPGRQSMPPLPGPRPV